MVIWTARSGQACRSFTQRPSSPTPRSQLCRLLLAQPDSLKAYKHLTNDSSYFTTQPSIACSKTRGELCYACPASPIRGCSGGNIALRFVAVCIRHLSHVHALFTGTAHPKLQSVVCNTASGSIPLFSSTSYPSSALPVPLLHLLAPQTRKYGTPRASIIFPSHLRDLNISPSLVRAGPQPGKIEAHSGSIFIEISSWS